jgi:uncharacterized RDD family membrane protein YckC
MSKRRFRDIKKKKHSQEATKQKIIYARYVDRVKAFITDMFLINMPILYLTTYVVLNGKDDFQNSSWAQFLALLTYAVIYALFLSKTGQTPGKKAYQIKVVKADTHELLTPLQAFLRFFAFSFSAMTIIGVLLPFYNKEKKALHDILLNTIEIELKEE